MTEKLKHVPAILAMLTVTAAVAQIRPTGATQPDPVNPVASAAKIAAPASVGTFPMEKSAVSLEMLKTLQVGFDNDLASFNADNPIDIWGKTRGVYVNDYGVIFTTELSPITALPITPFHQKVTAEEIKRTHDLKVKRLPEVKGLMEAMMRRTATHLSLMPDNQQVVLIVKLVYLGYEDVTGLPGQITMKGDKRSVLLGKFITTEQE
jgi:hypothetical protein